MKRKIIIIIIAIIFIAVMVLLYFNSNCYYAKKLVSAVQDENIVAIQEILQKKPTCINTVPTLMPKWFHVFVDAPRPIYALGKACYLDNIEIIQILIDAGADVNGVENAIPLSAVYLKKNDNWYEISKLLILNGASLEYATHYSGGKSCILRDIVHVRAGGALEGYIPESNEEVIKAFKYALENCDHDNIPWENTLLWCVIFDRVEIVKLLLDQKYCDVNDTDSGMTALMVAARNSTAEMVELLLDYGADKSMKCPDGKTAYDYAVQSNNADVIAILED